MPLLQYRWPLLAAGHWTGLRCRLCCDIGLQDSNIYSFCFQISENLHPCLMIRWWSGWRSVILSWCWPREDRGEWQWQRPRSGPRTSEWMTSVLITVRSDSTQPCRPAPGYARQGSEKSSFLSLATGPQIRLLIGQSLAQTDSNFHSHSVTELWARITNIFTPSSSTGSKL